MTNSGMDLKQYQRLAQKTSSTKKQEDKLINGGLGLAGEAGEVADLIKKWKFQGHKLEKEKIMEELGDVLWYAAETAEGLGFDLTEVLKMNISKLRDRYPNGKFEAEKSRKRKERV